MTSTVCPGGFQTRAIDALVGGGSGSFLSSFDALLGLGELQPDRVDPAAEQVDRLAVLGVVARLHPASMSGFLGSLTQSRAACSVRTMNSYSPVSGARTEPSQRIEKRWPIGLGVVRQIHAEVELDIGVDPVDDPVVLASGTAAT